MSAEGRLGAGWPVRSERRRTLVSRNPHRPRPHLQRALLFGDIIYSPSRLNHPATGRQVRICCAQPATDIVLDV